MRLNFVDDINNSDVNIDESLLTEVISTLNYSHPFSELYIYGYKFDNKNRDVVNVYYSPFSNVSRNHTQLVYDGELSAEIMNQINS
jgi:hypothetical protein